MTQQSTKTDFELSTRLQSIKILRDIFTCKDSRSLKMAFDTLASNIIITEASLEADFNRFFVGPMTPLADPFASIYLDNCDEVMSKSTLHVRNIYETMGFIFPLQNQIPDDYLGVELDAYYQLVYLEEVKNETYLQELRHYFLYEHLGVWLPLFIEKVLTCKEFSSPAITFIILELKSFLIRETNTQGVTA